MDTTPALTANDIESLRQSAADRGDSDLSSLCSVALWGNGKPGRAQSSAKRKLAKLIEAGLV